MKITYCRADLFTTKVGAIMHGCNAQGVMGSGVAAVIRQKYPEAYEAYVRKHQEVGLICGRNQYVRTNGKIIINAITQPNYGRGGFMYASYDAIDRCMESLELGSERRGIKEVAMPRIGAGLGGADWNVVAAIIESRLKTVKPYVYVLD
jgi:O-acetyl-ADP-ribose deacetylase (regulator of RNase III)